MVEGGAAAGVAVSRPEPDQSGDRASAQPRRHRRQRPGWNLQARFSPYAAGSPGFDPGIATHLLEQGVDIRVIQVLLGHAKLETTALYTRVAVNTVRDIKSPLDRLGVSLTKKTPPG